MKTYDDLALSILSGLKNDFQKDIFESAMELLKAPNIKTKFSNFATNIRELTRVVFHTLAPDKEVENCEWYEKETPEGKEDFTRVQRMTYAIKGGLSNQFIEEELGINFNEVTSKLNQVIQRLNKYTHINEKVYYRGDEAGYEMVEKTLVAFNDFLKTIDDCKTLIVHELEGKLYNQVSDLLTNDVIQEIDILATHYLIEAIILDSITVSKITSSNLFINVYGSVDVEHQYGSDGDFRRGDGIRLDSSYPFSISLVLDVNEPLEVSIDPDEIQVDNSSFYE
ncbi:hypothetical protein COL60_10675 [Bacillus pseudomycoides]|uniref:pPIWI-associating nuclease domain-containing protein n=1 Tax=Bacillus pseudomycoides TaxID=64104 RepID=UPI000BFAAAB0|nr:hypothetical protein [Bacillus pseudomycoides]PFZ10354.1 hypothetical protein COL60_10675 [Bacillus pseudomycoides]